MTSPLPPVRLPDLSQQHGAFSDRDLEVSQAERDRFADLIDGGAASDFLAARVGLTADGLEAGLRLGNLAVDAINGWSRKRDND